jgi:hypothetical protein
MNASPFFAKLVVFTLIGVNLGAYYIFWPRQQPGAAEHGAGRLSLKRDHADTSVDVAEAVSDAPAPVARPAQPEFDVQQVAAPWPQAVESGSAPRSAEPNSAAAPPDVGAFLPVAAAPAPRPAPDDQQTTLESLKNAVAGGAAALAVSAPAGVAKTDTSPWTFQMDFSEGRTLLLARLRQGPEFKVLCDRVEMKAPDGAVQTVGKVALTGPGVTATCQRLTLPLSGEPLVLEGQAEVRFDEGAQLGWELKSELLRLRLRPGSAGRATPVSAAPAEESAKQAAPAPANRVPTLGPAPLNVLPLTPTPPPVRP